MFAHNAKVLLGIKRDFLTMDNPTSCLFRLIISPSLLDETDFSRLGDPTPCLFRLIISPCLLD